MTEVGCFIKEISQNIHVL
uniref:Uncharacterized protein n=1 Tax=Rhizophora mucronata TaxID=61149 RepID=A0A2P2NXY1_RHIMU